MANYHYWCPSCRMALLEHEGHRVWLEMDECMVVCASCKSTVIDLGNNELEVLMKHDYKKPHYFQRMQKRRRMRRNIEAGLGAIGLFICIFLIYFLFSAYVPG